MALDELVQFLDQEKEKLYESSDSLKGFYHTLLESVRTLTVPFRNAFSPESSIRPALDPDRKEIVFHKHDLQSLEGEVQNNTVWMVNLVNNIFAIQNKYLQNMYFIELSDIIDIRQVHADIIKFLNELYNKYQTSISNSEMSLLAGQKKKDINDLLENHIDTYFQRLEQIKIDEYTIRIRGEIRDHIANLQSYYRDVEKFDSIIKEKCTLLGFIYNPDLAKVAVSDLETSDEALSKRIKKKYSSSTYKKSLDSSSIRRKYLKIVYRYLSRTNEIAKLNSILENIYYLFQPKPSLGERFSLFLSRLFGKEKKALKRDIEFNYIIGKDSIRRRQASLEDLMGRVNSLEKLLLKVKNHLNSYYIKKQLNEFPIKTMKNIIGNIRSSMESIFDDCFGLIQWLGKKSNKDKLEKIPVSMQKNFSQYLNSIHSTLIINIERLKEISRKYLKHA